MPNASRYLQPGYVYHLTHRCHDRRFLLKFARDRDHYRKWLRTATLRYKVPIFNYCITSNHVHLVVLVERPPDVARMMQLVAGTYASQWNRRKDREGSVWEHPYRATIVQGGRHLMNCLAYVSLNMVRAGQVSHPAEWRWCGHDELTGQRSRYRILDVDALLERLNCRSLNMLRDEYDRHLEDRRAKDRMRREAQWTEALAVGDRDFVERVASETQSRSRFEYADTDTPDLWSVRQPAEAYTPISDAKTRSKH